MKIIFLGATKNVTGSKFIVQTASSRVMIDAGLFQEREFLGRNWEAFPVDPAGLQAVLLTHAHIDHCGYLPRLSAQGFKGRVICSGPTADIARISLIDSAHLQEADAAYKKKRHQQEGRRGPYPEIPLYTLKDVEDIFPLFHPVRYGEEFTVTPEIKAVFYDAGHILGAGMIELRVQEPGGPEKRIVFSGDIGRWNRPILGDPHLFKQADYAVMEATYGDRDHEEGEDTLGKLAEIIISTKKAGGHVVIPTFAIGRAQELLYDLNELVLQNRIPALPMYLDSPMAVNITRVFEKFPDYYDAQARARLSKQRALFEIPALKFTSSVQESKDINQAKGGAVIMASSGMCTGGRVKHHLSRNIIRPESTILFVGYQAKGTLGRMILERPKQVRIFGHLHQVRARIEKLNGLSAHAGQTDLLRWATHFQPFPRKIFVVHSEEETARHFAGALRQHTGGEVVIPDYLDEAEL
ncbi:MAG TPA: MBL fold metallo-hydrolase [Candidatus Omnitrophota bacterium]|nr:MBL fold metallo-hydrolase [Candidatus Omnitrophota bacterium]HPB68416.1 MBL fold metallo-hydrolase [Candidatus Omnitrophota bacterium]HQO58644.1 MBL fold metallo-hydrolase [Candidatus Omnitrophota bacterium]